MYLIIFDFLPIKEKLLNLLELASKIRIDGKVWNLVKKISFGTTECYNKKKQMYLIIFDFLSIKKKNY